MDNRPIGVFDSGLGGLTAVKELVSSLPGERIIYFGDTGRMPYGGRSAAELMTIARQNIEFLLDMDVKLILAACGSVSTVALPTLAPKYRIPVFGVIEPAAIKSATLTKNGRIGIIATQATINGGAFKRSTLRALPGAQIFDVACPDLVPLIEAGHIAPNDKTLMRALELYLSPLRQAGIDTLLLGCTHYPLVSKAIELFMGKDVVQVGAAESAAAALCSCMPESLRAHGMAGGVTYITSGGAELFKNSAEPFLGSDGIPDTVRHVDPFPL